MARVGRADDGKDGRNVLRVEDDGGHSGGSRKLGGDQLCFHPSCAEGGTESGRAHLRKKEKRRKANVGEKTRWVLQRKEKEGEPFFRMASMLSTTLTGLASGFFLGLSVYKQSTSVIRKR